MDLLEKLRQVEVSGRTLLGLQRSPDSKNVLAGEKPAVRSFELESFVGPDQDRHGEIASARVQRTIDSAQEWIAAGGVAVFHWHWPQPLDDRGSAWLDGNEDKGGRFGPTDEFSLDRACSVGTDEWTAVIRDIDYVSRLLRQLPDHQWIFRPIHEMTGKWFWWSLRNNKPTDVARFARMIRDMFRSRGNNPIWLWSMSGGIVPLETRRECYPGGWDMIGMDVYEHGFDKPEISAWPQVDNICQYVAPDLPYCISECRRLPNPVELSVKTGRRPIYALQWAMGQPAAAGFAAHPQYLDHGDWLALTGEPEPPTEPPTEGDVIFQADDGGRGDHRGYRGEPCTLYDGHSYSYGALVHDQVLPRGPITIMFRFCRMRFTGITDSPVGMCEAVGFYEYPFERLIRGSYLACDVGEPPLASVRLRVQQRAGDGRVTDGIGNGSSPGKFGITWQPGYWHHAAMVYHADQARTLEAYLDDHTERYIQQADNRGNPSTKWKRIVLGACDRRLWGPNGRPDQLLLSDVLIVRGIVSADDIGKRARALGCPYVGTTEALRAMDRGPWKVEPIGDEPEPPTDPPEEPDPPTTTIGRYAKTVFDDGSEQIALTPDEGE